MPKNSYWIRDLDGVHALVEGAEARDEWTKVHGWSEATEPGPTDQVHVVNENAEIQPGRLPYSALGSGLDGYGWRPGPPSAPYDATKDPALTDVAAAPSAPEPVKPTKAQAADKGGDASTAK